MRLHIQLTRFVVSAVLVVAAGLTLPGCAILETALAPAAETPSGQVPIKERARKVSYRADPAPSGESSKKPLPAADLSGCDTSQDCLARLRALVESEKRDWIGQSVPLAEYATGVRLFAYRALRPKLSCRELTLALSEIDVATRTLHHPIAGVAREQVDRVRVLNAQVEGDLRAERAKRCGV